MRRHRFRRACDTCATWELSKRRSLRRAEGGRAIRNLTNWKGKATVAQRKLVGISLLQRFRTLLTFGFLCLPSLAFSPLQLFAEANITGLWRVAQARGDGSVDETYYRFKQNGAELTGAVQMAWGDLTIAKGTIHGREFHFEGVSLIFPGNILGDTMVSSRMASSESLFISTIRSQVPPKR